MKRAIGSVLLALCFLLAGCGAPEYHSDFFETSSIEDHLSNRSRLSGESASSVYVKHVKGNDVLPIWKVMNVEMEFQYDRDNDHVDIVSAGFFAHKETRDEIFFYGDELDTNTINDIDIEWWPQSDGTIYIDDVFFYGENGIYGFHIGQEIPG